MPAYLYPSKELGLTGPFELKLRVTTIGRHPNNDISLLMESVSRFHAKIEQCGSKWIITDLNSSNGTFINGERIATPRALSEGDVITVWASRLRLFTSQPRRTQIAHRGRSNAHPDVDEQREPGGEMTKVPVPFCQRN